LLVVVLFGIMACQTTGNQAKEISAFEETDSTHVKQQWITVSGEIGITVDNRPHEFYSYFLRGNPEISLVDLEPGFTCLITVEGEDTSFGLYRWIVYEDNSVDVYKDGTNGWEHKHHFSTSDDFHRWRFPEVYANFESARNQE
jgi:hypothetical protein